VQAGTLCCKLLERRSLLLGLDAVQRLKAIKLDDRSADDAVLYQLGACRGEPQCHDR
jgi:hypothetical protein